ncbi:MAG: formylglycine-generating enzyme family protein, partial [Mesorhizobium sp.]
MSLFILKVLPVALAAAAVPVGLSLQAVFGDRQPHPVAMTVVLLSGSITYPTPGEFLKEGRPQGNPRLERQLDRPLEIMAYQVGAADYADCV